MYSARKPGFAFDRCHKLFTSNPAAITSTTEMATSPITRVRLRRLFPDVPVRSPPVLRDSVKSTFDEPVAGTKPKRIPVRTESSAVNSSTRISTATFSRRGISAGNVAFSSESP